MAGVQPAQAGLAGQHKAAAAFGARLGNQGVEQLPGQAAPAVGRGDVQAEDHLPGAARIGQGGVFVHFIAQVGGVGRHAVDEPGQRIAVPQKQELLRESGQARGQGGGPGGLGRREAGGLDGGKRRKVAGAGVTELHDGFLPFVCCTRTIMRASGRVVKRRRKKAAQSGRKACIRRPYVLKYWARIATVQLGREVCAVAFFIRAAAGRRLERGKLP